MTGYLYRGDPWLEDVNAQILKAREESGVRSKAVWPEGYWLAQGCKRHLDVHVHPCPECKAEHARWREARQ